MKKFLAILMSLVVILGITSPTMGNAEEETTKFTVVFKDSSIPGNAKKTIKDLGGTIIYEVPEIGLVQVEAPVGFASNAINNSSIVAANPSLQYELPDGKSIEMEMAEEQDETNNNGNGKGKGKTTTSSETLLEDASLFDLYQWDIQRLTNDGATFAEHSGSHDVVVGIIDSGIDLNHPDVQKNLLPGSKNFVPAGGIYGVDTSETGDINDVQDRNGHGTHVAGSIAGNGAMLGVAPDVGFQSYRVFGAEGGAYSAWIMSAIVAAANDGVDVINMSLGGIYSKGQVYYNNPVTGEKERLGSDIAEYVAYMRAAKYAESKGTLIVSSAGNDAIDAKSPKTVTELANDNYGELGYEFQGASVYAPADIPNVVTVSATGPQDELAVYSTYGNGYVDVAAPGGNYDLMLQYEAEGKSDEYMNNMLYATEFAFSSVPVLNYITNEDGLVVDYEYTRPSYSWYVGTSMASPKVAAIAALLYDEHEGASPSDIKVMLKQTAEDIGVEGHDEKFGHGLTTVYSAFE
ncbi:S8 family peptidase [Pontibacillus marinus]|uniref:Peptidase S8 n=1 Tax=Pontibacillus marinus BH030004 = DSM 16465 TaxID=1385511 RepID=A0A0A5GJ79_9BACI|nr:S8 family serine peptidase [Pontibacillus marinus]KGX91210.1 peptidase S8 [Pontibacillus marinus BH030004 = DSM 16465]